MDLGLRGKLAVITGGSVGIGLAVAEAFAAEGANVLITARNEVRVVGEARRIEDKFKIRALGVPADVATASGCDAVIAAANDMGGTDILINNAGTGSNETIADAADEKWQYYWDLHVMAAVRLARGLATAMRRRGGGVILNNASICAKQPLDHEPIYNVTKAALSMFSKCLANELIRDNIASTASIPALS